MSGRSVAWPIEDLPSVGPAAVCMGVFDGVHRGHLALVAATRRAASARGVPSVALVFDPHPDEVVRPGTVVPRLAPLAENLRRLEEAGIDRALGIRFDDGLRSRTAEAFVDGLAPAIAVRALVMTPASAFGRGRAGTPAAMARYGRTAGFGVVLADPVLDGDEPISSARIRDLIADGDLAAASAMLGRPVYLEGLTDHAPGDGGPQAGGVAVRLPYQAALPPPGRYAARVRHLDGQESDVVDAAAEILDGQLLRLDTPMRWPGPPARQVALELVRRL